VPSTDKSHSRYISSSPSEELREGIRKMYQFPWGFRKERSEADEIVSREYKRGERCPEEASEEESKFVKSRGHSKSVRRGLREGDISW
jgi:hypothetical protein